MSHDAIAITLIGLVLATVAALGLGLLFLYRHTAKRWHARRRERLLLGRAADALRERDERRSLDEIYNPL